MENTEYEIIIEFRYGIEADEPFYELSQKLFDRFSNKDAPGNYDGHEIAMDNFDARLYFYSFHPQQTLSYIDDFLISYHFLAGGRILIRQNINEDSYTEVEIIAANGKRTPLSRFDMEQLSHIPDWGERRSRNEPDEHGEEWKEKLKNDRAERLYNKWKEIDFLITAIWDKWDLDSSEHNTATNNKSEEKKKTDNDSENDLHATEEESDFSLPKAMLEWHREEMYKNSTIIPPKISGAEAGNIYILRMENAAIIRKAAMDIYLDCHMLNEGKVADEQDIQLLRSEIEEFRGTFIEWINGFEPDDYADEWGLFVP